MLKSAQLLTFVLIHNILLFSCYFNKPIWTFRILALGPSSMWGWFPMLNVGLITHAKCWTSFPC